MTKPAQKAQPQPNPPSTPTEKLMWSSTLLLALVAVIAPLLADLPNGTSWTSLICAITLAGVAIALIERRSSNSPQNRLAAYGTIGIASIATLSFLWRWIDSSHGTTQYVDPMLRSVAYWASLAGLVFVGARCSRNTVAAYIVLVVVVIAAAICSGIGVQDYLIQVFRNHIHDWREFGTSTNPDYFAGYLIITIPLTLAMFLGAPSEAGKRASWLYAFALLLQLAALPTTGSRFAFVSFGISIVVFILCTVYARKHDFVLDTSVRRRMIFLAVVAALGALVFAGPILHRLSAGTFAAQAHSGDFRVWTWQGSLKMAAHYPIFGAGPGMFVYDYPRYAYVGFTRVAHSGYLQMLDDLGPLGLLAAIITIAGCLSVGFKSLKVEPSPSPDNPFLAQIAAVDNRFLIMGLISGVVAALVQNFIDSDWNITICGVTLFLCAGLLWGISNTEATAVNINAKAGFPLLRISVAVVSVLFALQCFVWYRASTAAADNDYTQAVALAPLSGEYRSDLAWKVQSRNGDIAGADQNLTLSLALAPDPVTFYRRASLYSATNRPQQALKDIDDGLALDPHSLELLKEGGEIETDLHDQAGALSYYQRMADEETSVYGTVLAISEIVEYRYAYADYALGDNDLKQNQPAGAISYLKRAQATLQTYVGEGGSTNAMRMAEVGPANGAALDSQLQQLYSNVMTDLVKAYLLSRQSANAATAQATQTSYLPRFIHAAPSTTVQP